MTSALRDILGRRVLILDGAMGTMLQKYPMTLDDFQGHEGCNEILNRTRPEVVTEIHHEYLEAGADLIETNTFGTNFGSMGEYGIVEQIYDLAARGTALARKAADEFSSPEWQRFVIGSSGPGTKLPTLGHAPFAVLRDAFETQFRAMIDNGVDAVQIETCQDLLQAKAAVIGAQRAASKSGVDLPIFVTVTVETTGTMLLGSEIGAAVAVLEPLGIDALGLNCGTGPFEMNEHLRYLSRHSRLPLVIMPNAGLPELTPDGAVYNLGPEDFTKQVADYVNRFDLSVAGGCCGTTPDYVRQLADAVQHQPVPERRPETLNSVASLYAEVPLTQDTSYASIGERTNANGSLAFRQAMLDGNLDECVEIAKNQTRDGAHILDLCVDYVGRDGTEDMRTVASRFATAVTLPIMVDSTEPEVVQAGLECLPGRSIVNSVNFEDGDGPNSRFARVMPIIKEHGAAVVALTIDEEGQARTAEWKVRVATRLIETLTKNWGIAVEDILVDCLTFPIATGQEETRKDGLETIEAIRRLKELYPTVHTTLGVSNISFGLNPAARVVLNSVFLAECVKAGLDSAIVNAARIMPVDRIPEEQAQVALDMVYDRRAEGYDPLARFLELFEGVTTSSVKAEREAELAALPLGERLTRRIVDGNDKGMTNDLDEAMLSKEPLDIVNEELLDGMKIVGELFGSGKMQLPFVLASAEVMKKAVAYLEPHMDASAAGAGKGTIVLATVKGDVHDIGKNLVDIIFSNNGYNVVNLGIKQPVQAIIEAALANDADAIGLSGLLVKSTVVMKDNLLELNERGLADGYPVLLGGAALTRPFVEHDLAELYDGHVSYARDAFEGLTLMDSIMAVKRGEPGAEMPAPRSRKPRQGSILDGLELEDLPVRSAVARRIDVPKPPFWGSEVLRGIPFADVVRWLDERALFAGRWGLRSSKDGATYDEVVETDGRPRLRALLDRIQSEKLTNFAAVYGYYPVYSSGDELVVVDPADAALPFDEARELTRFSFPRQSRVKRLCLADFFRDEEEARELGFDVLGMQLVTVGDGVEQAALTSLEDDSYRDYYELDGLSAQLGEALAEFVHQRVREELGFLNDDGDVLGAIHDQAYRGSRYSFGYPACPNLDDRAKIATLLDAGRIGVELGEEMQLHPEHSTDALVVHHPEAKYFNAN